MAIFEKNQSIVWACTSFFQSLDQLRPSPKDTARLRIAAHLTYRWKRLWHRYWKIYH